MKYSIPILMEFSQETVPCRWTADSEHCRLLQPLQPYQRQSSFLSEFPANRLVEETVSKSFSLRPAKPSTEKARLDFRLRTNNKTPSVASSSTEDSGFARFLRTHSSPLLNRVTAGGRIVPMVRPVDPVYGSSSADAQNAPRFLINQATVDDQPIEPDLGTVGAQVPEPSEHWGTQDSQSSTLVDGPTWPEHATLAFSSSLEPDDQYSQSIRRQNHVYVHGGVRPSLLPQQFQLQYHPPHVFPERPQADLIYETLNSLTTRQMSPDQLFRTLFPITTMHAFVPPTQFYLDAWMRSDDDRTGNWRGFVDSLIEQSAGNSNWMDGLYRDLLALYAPINRLIRDLDQIIARTLETRSRDRDMRVLYINMRQIVQEATGRLQPASTLVPAVVPSVAPNMAPGVSPLLNPHVTSTGTPLYQYPWTPQNGSLPYSPQRISRTLSNAFTGATGLQDPTPSPDVQPTGPAFFTPSGPNQAVISWLNWFVQNSLSMQRNFCAPDNPHGSIDDQNGERDPDPRAFDASRPQVNDTHVDGTHVDGIEPVLFGKQAHNICAPSNPHGSIDDQNRDRDPQPRTFDAPGPQVDDTQVNGSHVDGTEPAFFGEQARNYGAPDDLHRLLRSNNDWIRERDPEPRTFDAHGTHSDEFSLDKLQVSLAKMKALVRRYKCRVREYVDRAERLRCYHELPFYEEHEDPEEDVDRVERLRYFDDLPFRKGDKDPEQEFQQMMGSYEEPSAPNRPSLTSYSSRGQFDGPSPDDGYLRRGYLGREYDGPGDSVDDSNPPILDTGDDMDDDEMEDLYLQWPKDWENLDQAQDAIERWREREEGLESCSEPKEDNPSVDNCESRNEPEGDDFESGNEIEGDASSADDFEPDNKPESDDPPGGDVESSGNLNNEPEFPGEDQDERNHHDVIDRHGSIDAETTVSGQNVKERMLNDLSQGNLMVDIPHDQPIVQLSTDNALGEITQPGDHQHYEAATNTSVSNTAQAVPTGPLPWVRYIQACCDCLSVRDE